MSVDLSGYQLFLAVAFFLAACHAHAKLSPYFAATWFGSGLVFGYVWGGRSSALEVVLLPAVVFYLAAAATKGLVETRQKLAGNHVVHVLATGLFSGVVALPILACAAAAGWPVPGGKPTLSWTQRFDPGWFGGVDPDRVLLWMVAGTVFYGVYKALDHVGLGRPMQTVAVFGLAPFLPGLVRTIIG